MRSKLMTSAVVVAGMVLAAPKISVYSLDGKFIQSETYYKSDYQDKFRVNLFDLQTGSYILSIEINGKKLARKIIVK
jgi:hypothetical protein